MGRAASLSIVEKTKIDVLHSEKYSNRQIAKRLKRSDTVIDNYIKDPAKYGTKKSSGRKKKLNSRQKRAVIRLASNKVISSREIVRELELPVCRKTVLNVLRFSLPKMSACASSQDAAQANSSSSQGTTWHGNQNGGK